MPKWTADDIPDQTGRTAVVTGANGGLGLRTAETLAAHGARVVMACRNQAKAADALEAVKAVATAAPPEIVALDLSDLASVEQAAAEIDGRVDRIDVLVNNAGVMAIPLRRTAQGFEMQFGTNHLGHFALTGRLLPALHRASAPRVVTVSSIAHWSGRMRWRDLNWEQRYFRWPAYGQAKLANLLFAAELDRRAKDEGSPLISVAAHPGVSDTALYDVGPQMSGGGLVAGASRLGRIFMQSDHMGALPQLYAATMPNVDGNDYYGAALEFRGYPRKVLRSPTARSKRAARRLWDESERLTGVSYDWPADRA